MILSSLWLTLFLIAVNQTAKKDRKSKKRGSKDVADDVVARLDDESKAGYPLAEKHILIEFFEANTVPDCSRTEN